MLKKLAAIGLTVGALVIAAPVAANAADDYTTPPGVNVDDPIVDICEVSTIVFGPGWFAPSETVSVSVSGYNAGAASVSGNTASADGSLVLSFRPPSDAQGNYAVTFTRTQTEGGNGPQSYTAQVTVSTSSSSGCHHDPVIAAASGTELPLTGATELALTGGDVSPWVLGGGAAALVAGSALVAVGAARRKRA
ncbi:hypothetical protein [Microbacterium sp.]|uniref:hypothetical protein n=1 Tax=Microbacterium sp. TaxID=51671 RepID=UPI0039E501EF